MDTYTDHSLLQLLRSPAPQLQDSGLQQLYRQHYSMVEHFVRQNKGTKADAQDLFQDTLIAFFNKVQQQPDFELTCSIKTYLYSVARNLWYKKLRDEKQTTTINDHSDFISVDENPLEYLSTQEHVAEIAQLIAKLGEECQKVLTLFYFDNKRMKEISHLLKYKNDQVAKNKKTRCLKKLRNWIGEQLNMDHFLP